MNNTSKFEAMAMQSLLPGLTFAAERAIELLNQTRAFLSLAPVFLQGIEGAPARRGRPPRQPEPERSPALDWAIPEPEVAAPARAKKAVRRGWTPAQRKAIGERTRLRWEAIREAGIKPRAASPSKIEVERALRIIERRKTKKRSAAA
jgi:hypothetical protein